MYTGRKTTYKDILCSIYVRLALIVLRSHYHIRKLQWYFDIFLCLFDDCNISDSSSILHVVLAPTQPNHLVHHNLIDSCLVQDDMRLMAKPWLCIRSNIVSLDATLLAFSLAVFAASRPKGNLHDVVRLFEQGIHNAQALKDFDSSALHAVGLSHTQRCLS